MNRKWGLLKLCSQILDDIDGWEVNERDRSFTRRREAWKLKNIKFLSLKEGRRKIDKEPKTENVWQFWKKKSEADKTFRKSTSVKICEEKITRREELLKRLLEDKKAARTVKKKNRLREECVRIMSRMIEDWDSRKSQEDEEAYRRLEEEELKQYAVSGKQVADNRDKQWRVVMHSSNMAEHATKFEMKKYKNDRVQTVTSLEPEMTRNVKMTQPKMTTLTSNDQTEPYGSAILTSSDNDIVDKIRLVQHSELPLANLPGLQK